LTTIKSLVKGVDNFYDDMSKLDSGCIAKCKLGLHKCEETNLALHLKHGCRFKCD